MIQVSIAGIGGQGSVLAAKILAQAAQIKGWHVRSAETIGMAQRGGNVISHVRMGNLGEEVFAPLPAQHSIDVLIALEPGEAARSYNLVKPDGLIVVAKSFRPATAVDPRQMRDQAGYNPHAVLAALKNAPCNVEVIDDDALCEQVGSRKALNIIMLATTLALLDTEISNGKYRDNALSGVLTIDDMKQALTQCVKPRFIDMNNAAIDYAVQAVKARVE